MTQESKNEDSFIGILSDLLPSKDPFWRRFFVWWVVFNWRLVYITLFVSVDNIFYTKLDYLRYERFLIFDTQKDVHYILLTFIFGILFPYLATKIYYKKWFQRNIIHPIYESYAVSESNKSNILEKTAQVDRENIYYEKLKKAYRENIVNGGLERKFRLIDQWIRGSKGIANQLPANNMTREDLDLFINLGFIRQTRNNVNEFKFTEKGQVASGLLSQSKNNE